MRIASEAMKGERGKYEKVYLYVLLQLLRGIPQLPVRPSSKLSKPVFPVSQHTLFPKTKKMVKKSKIGEIRNGKTTFNTGGFSNHWFSIARLDLLERGIFQSLV
jgi:hypothetical protein